MTIREIMEAQQARHYCYDRGVRWACGGCEQDHPCPDYLAADAVLATLPELEDRITQAEARANIILHAFGIGTDRPPEEVFAYARHLLGIPDPECVVSARSKEPDA